MIDTVLTNVEGTTLGGTRFPAVPLDGQVVVNNNARYIVDRVEWHTGQEAKMVVVLRTG